VKALLKVWAAPKHFFVPESLVFEGTWFARARWSKEMTLLEFTPMQYLTVAELFSDIRESSPASPSVSLADSMAAA